MAQVLAVIDYINSLAEAEAQFGLSRNDNPAFFSEWSSNLPELSADTQSAKSVVVKHPLVAQGK